jgi:hypothetical protein
MSKSLTTDPKECPFLRPRMASHLEAFPIGVYCRLPSGRVRIPSRDELARFCTAGRHPDCPVYRRAHAWEITILGLA